MKLSSEAKVGVLIVSAVILLILGYNILKGNAVFSKSTTIYGIYHKVDGLTPANPVQLNGLNVGSVASLHVMDQSAGAILVGMTIKSKIQIPVDSKAKIVSSDLLGSKAIVLQFGSSQEYLKNEDTIKTTVEEGITSKLMDNLDPISENLNSTLISIDTVLKSVGASLDSGTQANLKQSIAALNLTMQNFSRTSAKLDQLVENLNQFTGNLDEQNAQINQILKNSSDFTSSLSETDLKGTVDQLNATVESLSQTMDKINNGQGSLGKLMNDDGLYENLNTASYNLNLLMEDIRINPKKYVHFSIFGGKIKPAPLPSDTLK